MWIRGLLVVAWSAAGASFLDQTSAAEELLAQTLVAAASLKGATSADGWTLRGADDGAESAFVAAAECLRSDSESATRARRDGGPMRAYASQRLTEESLRVPDAKLPYGSFDASTRQQLTLASRISRLVEANVSSSLSGRRRFGAGHIPALVHQMIKSRASADGTLRRDLRRWDDDGWRHAIWDDSQLKQLVRAAFPWLMTPLRLMNKHIQKIDTMRFCLLYLFGGLYIDTDDVRQSGDLHGAVFGTAGAQTAVVGEDPHALASVPRHPIFAQMLVWIDVRSRAGVLGRHNELTGPEGWRRNANAYRACAAVSPIHRAWPAFTYVSSRACGPRSPRPCRCSGRGKGCECADFWIAGVPSSCWGGTALDTNISKELLALPLQHLGAAPFPDAAAQRVVGRRRRAPTPSADDGHRVSREARESDGTAAQFADRPLQMGLGSRG